MNADNTSKGSDNTHVFLVKIRLGVFFTLQSLPIDLLVVTILHLNPTDRLAIVVKSLKLVLQARSQAAVRDAADRAQAFVGIDSRKA